MAVPKSSPNASPLRGIPFFREHPTAARLLLIALIAEMGFGVLNISTMPVYLSFERGFSPGTIGTIFAVFLLVEAIFKSPMGALADRWGRKRLLVIGPAICIFTSLATMLVPHVGGFREAFPLMVLRGFDGLGAAMFWPAAFALVGEGLPEKDREKGLSLINMVYFIGIALSLPLGGLANDLIGPYLAEFTGARSASLYLAAFLFALAAGLGYRLLPSGREFRAARRKEAEEAVKQSFREQVVALRESMRAIPRFLVLGALVFMAIGFPMVVIKLFAEQVYGLSETGFGLLVLPGAILMALLSVPLARLGAEWGRRKACSAGLLSCSLGSGLLASGVFFPAMREPWVALVGAPLIAIGFLLAIPTWYAIISDLDPKARARNLGAVMTAQGLGAIVGARLGSEFYGLNPFLPFLGTFLALVVAAIFFTIFTRDIICAPTNDRKETPEPEADG